MAIIDKNAQNWIDDVNENQSIGLTLPLILDNGQQATTKTTIDAVKQNIYNLCSTEAGERVMQPNFGVGIKKLIFEPNIDTDSLKEKISHQAATYVPEISIVDLDIDFLEDEHKLYIKLTYSINIDDTLDSIQLNFSDFEQGY